MARVRTSTGLLLALLAASPAAAQPFVYALTEGTKFTGTGQCRLSPCAGPQLLITNAATGHLLNAGDTTLGSFPGESGIAIAMAPDGHRAYALISTGASADRLAIIDTTTNQVAATVAVPPGVTALAVSPDSTRVYVASIGVYPVLASVITIVDPAAAAIVGSVRMDDSRPVSLAVSLDGRRVYAATTDVSIVDLATGMITQAGFRFPADLLVSPDGTRVYTSSTFAFDIFVLDTATLALTHRSVSPASPRRLAITPDGQRLFMTFWNSAGYGTLDLTTDTFSMTGAPNTQGGALAMAPDGTRVFFQADSQILSVDAATGAIVGLLPGGGIDLAVAPADPCRFELPMQDRWFGPQGGSGSISVPAPVGCAWTVQNTVDPAFVTFTTPTSGSGPGTVGYTVSPQPASSIDARRASIRIAGQVVSIVETFPRMAIDAPAPDSRVGSTFTLVGWAIDIDGTYFDEYFPAMHPNTGPGVDAIHVWAYPDPGSGKAPIFAGVAGYGSTRTDVGDAFGNQYEPSGFSLTVPSLPPGRYQLVVYAHGRSGAFDDSASVFVTVPASWPQMSLDAPIGGASDLPFVVSGWAIDQAAPSGTGVNAIHVWAFPLDGSPLIFLGAASYGTSRPDVGAVFGPRFASSGFSLAVTSLRSGSYWIVAFAHSTMTNTFADSRSAGLTVASTRVVIDTPPPGASGSEPLMIAGWAADFTSTSGPGIDAIHVWAYPPSGAAPVFVGAAGYGASRPDVAAVYGPAFANTGYTIDVTGLPPGTYLFAVWAHSSATGRFERCATTIVSLQ